MRSFSIVAFLLCLFVAGCNSGNVPEKSNQGTQGNALQKGPSIIETPEIIRILEEEDIEQISTSHRQIIHIRLTDGREYQGTYVHAQAGKYSSDGNLFDILNLVSHIKENRPAEEVKDWTIFCE